MEREGLPKGFPGWIIGEAEKQGINCGSKHFEAAKTIDPDEILAQSAREKAEGVSAPDPIETEDDADDDFMASLGL